MMISMNWLAVCDLVSLFGGLVMGVYLMNPRRYSGPRH